MLGGLGSSSQFGIGIAIHLQDKFSANADKVYSSIKKLKNTSQQAIDAAARARAAQDGMIAAGAAVVSKGYWDMARRTSEFGHKINQINILGEGKLKQTKQQLGKMAQQMAGDFATMPVDVTDAMLANIRANVTTGLSEVTRYQLATSKATGESVESVSRNLLGMTHAMDIPITNFGRVANAVTGIANASMSSVFSIGESMEYAAFTAKQFNIPLEQTLALIAKLSQSGIEGSSAGTALNNMIQYLGTSSSSLASPKQKKMWQMLGIDRNQVSGMMDKGQIFEVIALMDKAMSGISPSERISILRNLTNMRGGRGMMASWGSSDPSQSLEAFAKVGKDFVKGDKVMGQAKQMMNDPYSQFIKVQVAWENFKINFIASAAPMLMTILKGGERVINFMSKIADSPVGSVLSGLVAVGAPLISILFGFRSALLLSTFALRGMAGATSGGTFKQLMMGALNPIFGKRRGASIAGGAFAKNSAGNWYAKQPMMFGGKTFKPGQVLPRSFDPASGNFAMGPYANLKQNASGLWQVNKGQTFNLGGKIYKGGQILPHGFSPRMVGGLSAGRAMGNLGMGAMMASSGSTGASSLISRVGTAAGTGVAGRVLPVLGTIAGAASRLIPIVGWGMTIYSIYDLLKDSRRDDIARREKEDPEYRAYQQGLREQVWASSNPMMANLFNSLPKFNIAGAAKYGADGKVLQQQIVINVDGQRMMVKEFEQSTENFQKMLQFNLSH